MKKRFWLWRRNGVYYLQDAETRQKESLHTRDRREAERLRDARNDAAIRPGLGIALAKAYLSAHDADIAKRTWQDVMDNFCARGKPQTQERRKRAMHSRCFDHVRSLKLLETNASDFLAVLDSGSVIGHAYLRCLHNLAIGLGWLPWPVLPTKLWPALQVKSKRGITLEEHQQITSTETNRERRLYYELVWEIGASQTDAALLTADNINWNERILSYQRQKTGTWSYIKIGSRLEILLRQLPREGLLFPNWGKVSNGDRAAEFRRRCRILKIEGVSLHSYRYAWAERAKSAGYPERFAMQHLGHNSNAVTRAYAKNAHVILPPLEEYEAKIIQLPPQARVRHGSQKNGIGV